MTFKGGLRAALVTGINSTHSRRHCELFAIAARFYFGTPKLPKTDAGQHRKVAKKRRRKNRRAMNNAGDKRWADTVPVGIGVKSKTHPSHHYCGSSPSAPVPPGGNRGR